MAQLRHDRHFDKRQVLRLVHHDAVEVVESVRDVVPSQSPDRLGCRRQLGERLLQLRCRVPLQPFGDRQQTPGRTVSDTVSAAPDPDVLGVGEMGQAPPGCGIAHVRAARTIGNGTSQQHGAHLSMERVLARCPHSKVGRSAARPGERPPERRAALLVGNALHIVAANLAQQRHEVPGGY